MRCDKCGQKMVRCHRCKGEPNKSGLGGLTRLTCSGCNNNGYVCPDHGAR